MNYGFPDDDDYDNDYDDDDMNNRNNNNNNNNNNIIIRNYNNPTTTNNDIDNNDNDDNDNNDNNDDDVPVHLKNYDGYLKDIIIDNDAIDEAPKMPLDYYNSIDNFLKQGPPKIKTKNSNTTNEKTNSNKINTNSNKNKAKEPKMRVLPPAPVVPVAMSKIDCGGKDTKGKKKKIDIDHNLLLAAFSYVDQISREVHDDDDDAVLKEFNTNTNTNNRNRNMWPSNNNDNNNNNISSSSMKQPRSAPAAPNVYYDTAAPKKKGSKKNSSNSIVKKLRSQTAATANMNTFEISSAIDNNDDRRNALDFDALVSNFEQGLTIKKLKADLQDSKQAMANSLAFMKQIKSEMRF